MTTRTYTAKPNREPRLHVTDIHYVNSLPGAGKTRAALNIARAVLSDERTQDPETGFVLVYAAPTHALLTQFNNNLRKRVGPDLMKRVHLVTSKGGGLTVAEKFRGLISGFVNTDVVIRKVPNGSVILITHECALAVEVNMKGKDRVSFIFDEARQCMQSSLSMKAPVALLDHLQANYVHTVEALPSRSSVARWVWIPGRRLTEQKVRELWIAALPEGRRKHPPRALFNSFMKFVEALRAGSQHVWVELVAENKTAQDFRVNVTLSPARVFANYGKVLILSAYFEHSQMYYMLKRQEVDTSTKRGVARAFAQAPEERVSLLDVTSELIDKRRIRKILNKRLSKATMTYILEDESLSKYHLTSGIVIDYQERKVLSKLARTYQQFFEAEGHNRRPVSYKKFISSVQSLGGDGSLRSEAIKRFNLLNDLRPSKHSVVQYLALQSSRLQRAWLKTNRLKTEPLLLCVNAKDSRYATERLWQQEDLTELLGNHVTPVPVVCQGLNEWMDYNTAAFMATVKMSKDQRDFLTNLLPGYNPDLDRTVDQCIQFIFRCSLRDAKADTKCFIVVSDRKLALQVQGTLGTQVKIVAPSHLIPKWRRRSVAVYAHTATLEQKREWNRKHEQTEKYKTGKAKRNKAFSSTAEGKRYAALTQQIRRRRLRLEKDPTNKALIKEIDKLTTERTKLRTT